MSEGDNIEKDKSSIEGLEEGLYSRDSEQVVERERREMHDRDFGVSENWESGTKEMGKNRKKVITLKLIFSVSVIFFLVSALLSTYFFMRVPSVSPENILINVQGPALIGGGEELGFQVEIINKNPVPLQSVNLIIEYPDGTRSSTNIDEPLLRYVESLDVIEPGDEINKTLRAVLFGEENTKKEIKITLEYRIPNSNSIFYTEHAYELALSSSPLSLVVESLDEAISGQDVSFTVTVSSNSGSVVRDVLLEVQYPFGFKFESSSPSASFADRLWKLGDIPPEGEKKITFHGTLSGGDGEERIFRFATGLKSENDDNVIGAAFINTTESLFIKRPFISASLALDGSTADNYVGHAGKTIRGDITWVNNLPTRVFDGEIEISFDGKVLDRHSITSDTGFYRSVDDKIIWTRETERNLASIDAGQSGRVGFAFSPLELAPGSVFHNPEIDIEVTISGKRLSGSGVPETIVSSLSRKVKVASNLHLSSKSLHFSGPFQNTGPMPPVVEQETTYTVVLSVVNTSNEIANGYVTAELPSYVEWVGSVTPSNEEVMFNPVGGLVTWNLEEVSSGTGSIVPKREIAFQVRLLPSISHIGDKPTLLYEQTVKGYDRFVQRNIESVSKVVNTTVSDPGINPVDYAIVKQ